MVAFQIEWNKVRTALRDSEIVDPAQCTPADCASALGGAEADWLALHEFWGAAFGRRLGEVAERHMALRVRMLGGTQVGYARVTRRWWQQVTGLMRSEGLLDRPLYFVSSNSHSISNLLTGTAQRHEQQLVEMVESRGPGELRDELARFKQGSAEGSWNNFLFYAARVLLGSAGESERTGL